MGKKGRGRERQVTCEKCGRTVRRDKAVFYEKAVFINPIDRSQVYDTEYSNITRREVAYCPSCGKHGRIYEKKKKLAEQRRERLAQAPFGNRPRRPFYGSRPAQAAPAQGQAPAQQSQSQVPAPAEEKKAGVAAEKEITEEKQAEEQAAEQNQAEEKTEQTPEESHLEKIRREVQQEGENQ